MSAKRATDAKRKKTISLKVGDTVLVGGTRASMPSDWFPATVLWADERNVLLHRTDHTGSQSWREVVGIECIRAVGPMEPLVAARSKASEEVRDLVKRVREIESDLGRARDAIWTKIDDLAETEPAIIPFDEEAIEAHDQSVRAAIEAYDEQYEAQRQDEWRLL